MTYESDQELGAGKTCFIVSPIGDELASIGTAAHAAWEQSIMMWSRVFKPACEAFSLTPIRADKIASPGEIPDQIFTYLRDADVVIADLSGANPNVMYELGLRHSRQAITLQVGENERLPFDVATIRTIKFIRDEAGLIEVRNRLIESLRSALEVGATDLRSSSVFAVGSPVNVNVDEDARRSAEPDSPDDGDDDAPGVIELLAEAEAAVGHISDVLNGAVAETETISARMQDATAELNAAANSTFASRLAVSRKLSDSLREPSEELERLANEYFTDVEKIDVLVRFVVERAEEGSEDKDELRSFFETFLELVNSAEGSLVGISGMRDGARDLRRVSSALKTPSQVIERALNRQIEATRSILAWRPLIEGVMGDDRPVEVA